ncbi:MAG: metallophosphoesterase, partial [Candidatus Omnitrophica bacterium]|nr:metallophosphoesterase [Candidatus Omnitrophota bacterium]
MSPMRIGVISDTHIPDRAKEIPQKILAEFKNVDMIVHAGDFAQLSVLNKLKSVCENIKAVRGNMDPDEIKRELPEKEVFKVGPFKVALMHGYGAPNNLIELLTSVFKDEKPDVIIFGHSHSALNEKRNGILFFNPGSATDKIFSPYNS